MALLEERRRKLAAEGLFDPARKRAPPYLPGVIGVVTSPTGAVIRDILHRLADRFPPPCPGLARAGAGRIQRRRGRGGHRGFNALPAGGAIPRPDVLIVARGGGSIEDLWGFNEEIVVRAAAESAIPLIAAVGHETDVTLIDHAADVRAPTPIAAAEKAVPVQIELLAALADLARRRMEAMLRGLERRRTDLRPPPARCLRPRRCSPRNASGSTSRRRSSLQGSPATRAIARRGSPAERPLAAFADRAARRGPRPAERRRWPAPLGADPSHSREGRAADPDGPSAPRGARRAGARGAASSPAAPRPGPFRRPAARGGERSQFERKRTGLAALSQLFESLNYKAVLARGYALARDADGDPVSSAAAVHPAQALAIEFADGIVRTTADGPRPKRRVSIGVVQGSLFEA